MADPITWYALGRTITDIQTIMEMVDEKMLGHNQDPSAHGQSGEGLFNHRIAEILDHLDHSIRAEKMLAVIDDADAAIVYTGGWATYTGGLIPYFGTYHFTSGGAGSLEYTFTGTQIGVICMMADDCGYIDIYIDEVFQERVDLYSPTDDYRVVVYENTALTDVEHTIRVESINYKNPLSTDTQVRIDGLKVGNLLLGSNIYLTVTHITASGNLNGQGFVNIALPGKDDHMLLTVGGLGFLPPWASKPLSGDVLHELMLSAANTVNNSWQTLDLSSYIPYGSLIVETLVRNKSVGQPVYGGVRAYGSSNNRVYQLDCIQIGGANYFYLPADLGYSRKVNIYSSDKDQMDFRFTGYTFNRRNPKAYFTNYSVALYDGEPLAYYNVQIAGIYLHW